MLEFDLAELELDNTLDFQKEINRNPLRWPHDDFDDQMSIDNDYLLKLELPLFEKDQESYGTLRIVKNLRRKPVSHYTFRRVEQLRRSFMAALELIAERK